MQWAFKFIQKKTTISLWHCSANITYSLMSIGFYSVLRCSVRSPPSWPNVKQNVGGLYMSVKNYLGCLRYLQVSWRCFSSLRYKMVIMLKIIYAWKSLRCLVELVWLYISNALPIGYHYHRFLYREKNYVAFCT